MHRQEIIQKLINHIGARSYLEIGLGNGEVHNNIDCKIKVGVDPCEYPITKKHNIQPTFKLTSDDFFAQNQDTFDVIFIDGMHEASYVEKDINNSLSCLNDGGYIVCHDMNPLTKKSQIFPRIQSYWHGDVWKAWVKIRQTNPNVSMCVIPEDCGLGIIQKGSQELLDIKGLDVTYENLKKHRKEWLNLISLEEFLNKNGLR